VIETETAGSMTAPVWVYVVNFLQVALVAGLIALAVFAGWKAFVWLSRSRPPRGRGLP